MNQGAFSSDLNALFADRCHNGLEARNVVLSGVSGELLITSDSVTAMQTFHQALRDEAVNQFLCRWSGSGELHILVQGLSWTAPVPAALVREGKLLLVSGSSGAAVKTVDSECFESWFEELVGAQCPISLELVMLKQDFWGSRGTTGKELVGFPHTLRSMDLKNYTLLGFGGYGTNSYALYLTRVSGETQMFLRIPWGGVYMDVETFKPRLLQDLLEANSLFVIAAQKSLPMYLNNNMGDWYFAPGVCTDHRNAEQIIGLEKVRAYLDQQG